MYNFSIILETGTFYFYLFKKEKNNQENRLPVKNKWYKLKLVLPYITFLLEF